jgi:UDP-N-acetylmuramoyl-tripeptide--D-alanyl-D-alanine ligase
MDFNFLSWSTGGRLISFSDSKGVTCVSLDSRSIEEGALFIALPGAVSDGHSFVESAFNSGAVAAMVEAGRLDEFNLVEIARNYGKNLLVVDNTLRGLQSAARAYLEQFPNLLRIGITGSSGKTTTKEITASVISCEKKVVMNQGNLNSDSGLPLAVFSVRSEHEVGVFELGMNRKGEIAELAAILKPNVALITNIGPAHIGLIGSIQGIAEEKKNIFSCFTGGGIALIPVEDQYRDFLAHGVNGSVRFFGAHTFTELESVTDLGLEGSEIVWAGEKIRFNLPGKFNLANAIAAVAIAKELNVSAKAVKEGLESAKPIFGRGEILYGRTTVIRDCYNANPESMRQSVEFCNAIEWQGRKIYVIADMLELGCDSLPAHEQLGRELALSDADKIFLFGEEVKAACKFISESGKQCFHTSDFKKLSDALDGEIQKNDLVLLKGSRGCALERLTEMLTGIAGAHKGDGHVS